MRLLLVDGTNVVMRCASVQTDVPRAQVIASAGRMIRRAAVDVIAATHLIVAFDAPGQSFRKALYPAYKAHRGDRQLETTAWAVDACATFTADAVFCVLAPEFEADDVIATLAARATGQSVPNDVHILSGDSDLLALQAPHVHCWQFGQKGEASVVERSGDWICQKYGISTPAQLTDYKTLVGEPGDNVVGVKGVGPVKARALLKEFGSLAEMNRYGVLGAQAEWSTRARALIDLRTDAPIPRINPSDCRLVRRSNAA